MRGSSQFTGKTLQVVSILRVEPANAKVEKRAPNPKGRKSSRTDPTGGSNQEVLVRNKRVLNTQLNQLRYHFLGLHRSEHRECEDVGHFYGKNLTRLTHMAIPNQDSVASSPASHLP